MFVAIANSSVYLYYYTYIERPNILLSIEPNYATTPTLPDLSRRLN